MAGEKPEGEKKKRKSGPRVAKDKVVYLTFKGQIEPGSVGVHFNADGVLAMMDADPSLQRARVVIPAKNKVTPVAA